MPQMFRVGDLAQQMGVSVDELIFKLRSIGVEVGNANDTLDLPTVRAIITGETLQRRPREVIVRREAAPVEEARQPAVPALERLRRKRPARRLPGDDVPDEVPNLEAMTLPASAPRPRAVPPVLPVPPEHVPLSVDRQEETENSVLSHYRRIIAFRRAFHKLFAQTFCFVLQIRGNFSSFGFAAAIGGIRNLFHGDQIDNFVESITGHLLDLGLDPKTIRTERFGG